MPPSNDASELIRMTWSSGSDSPYACSAASSTSAKQHLRHEVAAEQHRGLARRREDPLEVLLGRAQLRRDHALQAAPELRHDERDGERDPADDDER